MSKSNSCFNALVARAARTVSTPAGLDGGLQFMAYTGPVAAQLVLKLAQARINHPVLQKLTSDTGRLTELAAGIVRGAGNVSEARVIMRAFGLIPMLDWLLRLHPNPAKALANFFLRPSLANLDLRNEKVFQTLRVILLSIFYVGEHSVWLGTRGILNLTPQQLGFMGKLSIRSWAIDVGLSAVKLVGTYRGLVARQAALQAQGEKKVDAEEAKKLAAEFAAWKRAAWVNFAWIPLTIHWSIGGLWENPLITAAIGSVVSVGKLNTAWASVA
ncbi:uncharacterized protein CcaverHIS019_0310600 [Cutaneotrichosporon cavernicola]|uniref:Peroxisomal biogenesis factor 11 n=1 Tax=Cutaneotrichosporon cavernicola TaxID=279322 RepID=A0AA48QV32_9TREE|nr:uncharacterized protein CcaverHIS019_0310600 [Cutaneotrichosporon cavernicola]BEI90990.1 hypothetical protein CcaverHIS019_0310600 [Cutaneotrichosporon cavernicola]